MTCKHRLRVPNDARLALFGLGAYGLALRPQLLRWGATDAEVAAPYPGAEIIPGGKRSATMAVTIEAPPPAVWAWLAQMGCSRAGWYSWDRLDNGGVPSAERVHPEWQDVAVGDRWSSVPSGAAWFEVAAVERERFLALRAPLDMRGGKPFDVSRARPRMYSDSLWAFLLEELPGRRTRLIVSGYAAGRPKLLFTIAKFILWEPTHWIMQTRQFANLKRRSESSVRTSTDSPSGDSAGVGVAPVDAGV
jgi:proline iminopeptidase